MTIPNKGEKEVDYAANKASHDVQMSPMSPSFCRKCKKGGSDLSYFFCKFSTSQSV